MLHVVHEGVRSSGGLRERSSSCRATSLLYLSLFSRPPLARDCDPGASPHVGGGLLPYFGAIAQRGKATSCGEHGARATSARPVQAGNQVLTSGRVRSEVDCGRVQREEELEVSSIQ